MEQKIRISEKTETLNECAKKLIFLREDSKAYKIFNEKDEYIGAITYDLYANRYIVLDCLEILPKYQDMGYGRLIVNHLMSLDNIKGIEGIAAEDAVGFWENVGAIFSTTCDDCSYIGCVHNPLRSESDLIEASELCDDWSDRHFRIIKK